jgi:hypothetical protein
VLLAIATACAGPPAPAQNAPALHPKPVPGQALPPGRAPASQLTLCRVEVEHARVPGVLVTASGTSFTVDLQDVPMVLEAREGSSEAQVDVLAPLRFHGRYPVDRLAFRAAAEVELQRGRIRLGKGAAPTWLGVRGRGLRFTLDQLRVEVEAELEVDCSHVGLSDGTPYAAPAATVPPAGHSTGAGPGFVPLYVTPKEVDPLRVRYAGPFSIEATEPGWVLIEATWADGSRLRGWTPERNVTPHFERFESVVEGRSWGPECTNTDAVLTQLVVRKGASVAASPAGPVWARVTQALTVDALPLSRQNDWIPIADMPGLPADPCTEHQHFWVNVSDVKEGLVPRVFGRER